jgi:hypothetical protein
MSSSRNTQKMNLRHVFNTKLSLTYMEPNLDNLGIAQKLVKNVIYLLRQGCHGYGYGRRLDSDSDAGSYSVRDYEAL